MKVRFPLFLKILAWFFVNLIVLGVASVLFWHAPFRSGLDAFISGRAGEKVQAVSDLIMVELHAASLDKWTGILKQFDEAYHVHFHLFENTGRQVAGEPVTLPANVYAQLTALHAPLGVGPPQRQAPPEEQDPPGLDPAGGGPPPTAGPPPPQPQGNGNHPRTMLHSSNPSRYWVFIRVPGARSRRDSPPDPSALIIESETITAGGLFFDPVPWFEMAGGALILSALLWLPFVTGITRFITQMTRATEQIAEGRFEVRVKDARHDELGSLGGAINRMATRLAGFVGGQKRFLGDIAHELCSPLARMQVALSILEDQHEGVSQNSYVADVREEVEQMSQLVNELLSFSKASLGVKNVKLSPVSVAETAYRIVNRENRGKGGIVVDVDPSIKVLADPELLARSMGNVVRNAIRYANPVDAEGAGAEYSYRPRIPGKEGQPGGPIVISATTEGERVVISIADHGPGIAEEALAQVFDPFYRTDTSRARETGGVGLGLAIVKTCVESSGGTVTARNRQPNGLEVLITLTKA